MSFGKPYVLVRGDNDGYGRPWEEAARYEVHYFELDEQGILRQDFCRMPIFLEKQEALLRVQTYEACGYCGAKIVDLCGLEEEQCFGRTS